MYLILRSIRSVVSVESPQVTVWTMAEWAVAEGFGNVLRCGHLDGGWNVIVAVDAVVAGTLRMRQSLRVKVGGARDRMQWNVLEDLTKRTKNQIAHRSLMVVTERNI